MKLYYFYTLKALWDGQGKIKMYYGMSRLKGSCREKGPLQHYSLSLLFNGECDQVSQGFRKVMGSLWIMGILEYEILL